MDHPFNMGGRESKLVTEIQSRVLCLGRLSTNTGVIPAFRAPTTSSCYLFPTYNNSEFSNPIILDPMLKNLVSGLSHSMSSEVSTTVKYLEMARASRSSLSWL